MPPTPLLNPTLNPKIHILLQGSRTTVYKCCTHDIFASFGECARWDGLVERLTRFSDDSRHVVEEVRRSPALPRLRQFG